MELVTALASMKAGIELATIALEARDDRKMREAIREISARLADANMDALAMSTTLRKLEAELRDMAAKLAAAEKRITQRELYVLREIRPGAYVQSYAPLEGSTVPAHDVCQACFDKGALVVLQLSADGVFLVCPENAAHSLVVGRPNAFSAAHKAR